LDQGSINNIILIILLALLVASAIFAVMIRNLLKAAIALAATSVVLTVIMFVLGSPIAAVFELSVCAGLITAVFISAISLTKVSSQEELDAKRKARMKKFIYLPIIAVLLGAGLLLSWPSLQLSFNIMASGNLTVQSALWDVRQLDVIGQIIIIIAGVFGVVVLFKEQEEK
jgi:NADH-quinone oxidoreductase subunit J